MLDRIASFYLSVRTKAWLFIITSKPPSRLETANVIRNDLVFSQGHHRAKAKQMIILLTNEIKK